MNQPSPPAIEKKRIAILCVVAVVALLFATLWPFNPWPANNVTWLPEGNGLRFGRGGVVLTTEPLQLPQRTPAADSCSLELLLRPESVDDAGTILGFYGPDNSTHLLVRQWTDGLLVTHDSVNPQGKTTRAKFDVDHAFRAGKLLLLTITSGPHGTVVYRDSVHARTFPRFTISPREFLGQIVLGTAPVDFRPWLGEVHGLAIYSKELTPADVSRHYAEWFATQPLKPADQDATVSRYTFSERAGAAIQNEIASAPDLQIPANFDVPHKVMLTSAIKEFEPTRVYLNDVIVNIVGFVPLGIILCAYFSFTRSRSRAILFAALIGTILSLIIEVLQAYIPSRGSGTTDVITNGLGTLLGAAIIPPDWVRTLLQAIHLLPKQKTSPPPA